MKTAETAEPYEWDFDGACAPPENGEPNPSYTGTFTLGVFQWIPKARGKQLKRGLVKWRAKGDVRNPRPAFEAARKEVARLNSQT